jgi:hypothetical protein
MNVGPVLFTNVAASAACRALLGTPPKMRFYAFGEAPQGVALPYAVWQMITGTPANYLGQLPDLDRSRVQIDVYGAMQSMTLDAAVTIRDALEPHGYLVNFADRGRDPTTRNYGYMLDFELHQSR